MQTIRGISNFKAKENTVITIGTFDGVHIGHVQILERVKMKALKMGLKSVVLTFFPHPRMVLQKDTRLQLLNTLSEKEEALRRLGIDYFVIHPFTKEFSRLPAENFVKEVLVEGLNARSVVIGYDHRFGRNRAADIEDLTLFGTEYDFEVDRIEAQEINDIAVSSTKIRNALKEGDIRLANQFLGRPYQITGRVTKGKGLGRQLGFRTANLTLEEAYKLLPQNGVYAVTATINHKNVLGMMNIGTNPTVDGTHQHIEVHFFDFNQDLYGQSLQVYFHQKIRDEIKFADLEALKYQLKADEQTARKYLD